MRIYQNFPEAFSEVKRDLKEMGVEVQNKMYQDKQAGEEYTTLELWNYGYTVVEPDPSSIGVPNPEWLAAEWEERQLGMKGHAINPGTSWRKRDDEQIDWASMLEVNDQPADLDQSKAQKIWNEGHQKLSFSYSYPERLSHRNQVTSVIRALKNNKECRQGIICIWSTYPDVDRLNYRRVPCSMYYHALIRNGRLNLTYHMRSCELGTHFYNDVWFAVMTQRYIAEAVGIPPGQFAHIMNSFHVYKKNVADVF